MNMGQARKLFSRRDFLRGSAAATAAAAIGLPALARVAADPKWVAAKLREPDYVLAHIPASEPGDIMEFVVSANRVDYLYFDGDKWLLLLSKSGFTRKEVGMPDGPYFNVGFQWK